MWDENKVRIKDIAEELGVSTKDFRQDSKKS